MCPRCNKNFKGALGLSSHLSQSTRCRQDYLSNDNVDFWDQPRIADTDVTADHQSMSPPASPLFHSTPPVRERPPTINEHSPCLSPWNNATGDDESVLDLSFAHYSPHHSSSLTDTPEDDNLMLSDGDADDTSEPSNTNVGTNLLSVYDEVHSHRNNPMGLSLFSIEEKVQVELLSLLKKMRAPLSAFSDILKWAANSNESGHIFLQGQQPSREKAMRFLMKRFNMENLTPKHKSLYLPYSKQTVKMVYYDAHQVFASLLSCPSLNRDEHYLFSEFSSPFEVPSPDSKILGDINTGRCYHATYAHLVKDRNLDMLFPCIIGMDKTNIDTYGRLAMEPITVSHGLLKHEFRSRPNAMRILGYICHQKRKITTGLLFEEGIDSSGDDDSASVPDGVIDGRKDINWADLEANEIHMQISFILRESGYLNIQDKGFHWKIHFKGKIFPVVLHPYVPFIVGDTDGHDRLCGHYTARFHTVKQLCRICECPTEKSDYSLARYPYRTAKKVNTLVAKQDLNALQAMSQKYLHNAFDSVRFGAHNNRGIFGACPGEVLHMVSLGWVKYALESFSAQVGPQSMALKQYDALCAKVSQHLCRHNDQSLPRLSFPKGVYGNSHLMGHEYAGCLIVKLFALHTTAFSSIFEPPKSQSKIKKINDQKGPQGNTKQRDLSSPDHVHDWIVFIQSLLQWMWWMKQPTITKQSAERSHLATQWLMRRLKFVSPRPKGMKNLTVKTHLVLHLSQDMLDHGVPSNVNSTYAESAHIELAKVTSRRTQKRYDTFVLQSANRYIEDLTITRAIAAITESSNDIINRTPRPGHDQDKLCGRRFTLKKSLEGYQTINWHSGQPKGWIDPIPYHVLDFLLRWCAPLVPNNHVVCHTEASSSDGQCYRAHPCYLNGKPWYDHCFVTWAGHEFNIPARIYTFVDLSDMKVSPNKPLVISKSGQKIKNPGLYAVVHSLEYVDEDEVSYPNVLVVRCRDHYAVSSEGTDNCSDSSSDFPTIFLVELCSLVAPALCTPDISFKGVKSGSDVKHRSSMEYLVLCKPPFTWHQCWESMISSCWESRHTPNPESDEDEARQDEVYFPLTKKRKRKPR